MKRALAAAFLAVSFCAKPPPPAPTFRLYVKDTPAGAQRLLAEVPTAQVLTVNVRSEVQVFAQPPPAGQTLVVETAAPQRTVRAELAGRAERADLAAVGASFTAGSLGPGEARVCATLSRDGDFASSRTCATFIVTP